MTDLGSTIAAGSDRTPRRPSATVPRDGLRKRLLDAPHDHLVVAAAPAGFGKSTTLAQWDDADDRPFAWIHLDGRDDDPAHLLVHVVSALELHLGDLTETRRAIDAPGRSIDGALDLVVDRLSGLAPAVLVVDDVHAVQPPGRHLLERLVAHGPPSVQIVLSGRQVEGFGLARRRLGGSLTEIDAGDLAMSADEAAALFDQLSTPIEPEVVATLVSSTEGWVGGLRLAALALEHGGPAALEAGLSGRHRLVTDYLVEEVLTALRPDEVAFLERAAVIDRLDGSLADEVLLTAGSAECSAPVASASR